MKFLPPFYVFWGRIKATCWKSWLKEQQATNSHFLSFFFPFFFSTSIYLLIDVNTMDKAKMGGACSDPKSEIVNLGWRKLHRRWPITRGTIEDWFCISIKLAWPARIASEVLLEERQKRGNRRDSFGVREREREREKCTSGTTTGWVSSNGSNETYLASFHDAARGITIN